MGVISTDTTASSAVISYTTDDETWTVQTGFTILSTGNYAVTNNNLARSTLTNNGNILSSIFAGVDFGGDGGQITNNSGHSISGYTNGVEVNASETTVTNHGFIFGLTFFGVTFVTNSENDVVNNDGQIYGRLAGVRIDQSGFVHTAGSAVNNSGLIVSDHTGILLDMDPGIVATIANAAGGVIKGADAAIAIDGGKLSLDNRGTLTGGIDCNATTGNVNDVITNSGRITGQVRLGAGNDSFNGAAGATAVSVLGEAGTDKLFGSKAADTLDGGVGIDTIRGGLGKDSLFGGTEADVFDFNSKSESVKGSNRDQIKDFSRGQGDKIDLETIDADTSANSGNDKFKFIGKDAFKGGGGELRYIDNGDTCTVQGDINGDKTADFEIRVTEGSLQSGDFFL